MRLHVRVIGNGTEASPFRVALPTYQLAEIDYLSRQAIVDVPDDGLPDFIRKEPRLRRALNGREFDVHALSVPAMLAFERYIQNTYRESHSDFDVTNVLV